MAVVKLSYDTKQTQRRRTAGVYITTLDHYQQWHILLSGLVTIHGVKCLVLQSHDLHAGRLQQSPSSYQDDHERCAAFRPARLHFLRLFYLTLTRSRGTAPLPLPDSHPSAVSMHSSRSIHSSCMSPRSSAVLRSTAHTQRFQTDRIPSSCSLRL